MCSEVLISRFGESRIPNQEEQFRETNNSQVSRGAIIARRVFTVRFGYYLTGTALRLPQTRAVHE